MTTAKPPLWVWVLLVAAIFGVSSAGTLLQQIELDPLLKGIMAIATDSGCFVSIRIFSMATATF
jgi:hypothetical protein